jgi:steroid 5-alpha reductase family enzyme
LKNASVYDPYWSVQPIVIVVIYALTTHSLEVYHILPLIAILLWGIRLTVNWAYTFKNLTHQDWRYTMLCNTTGKFYPIVNFVGIHMVPTLVVYLCVLPVAYLFNGEYVENIYTYIFAFVSIFAFVVQGIADIQMHKFRKNRTSTFIRNGLWKYSRHPNYLGEILMWWGIGLLSVLTMKENYFLIAGAIANTLLFLFISIPLAENHQKSRKEGFDQYKKETRMLLPIYKRVKNEK